MFPLSKKPRKDLDRRSKRQLARNTKCQCHILNSAPAVSSFSGENGLAKILGQFLPVAILFSSGKRQSGGRSFK